MNAAQKAAGEAAERRLRGNRAVGLAPDDVRAAVRYGADTDPDEWPRSTPTPNTVADAMVDVTRKAPR